MNKIFLVIFTQANQYQVIERAFDDYNRAAEYRTARQLESAEYSFQDGSFEIEIVDFETQTEKS